MSPYLKEKSKVDYLDKSHINDLTGYVSRYLTGHSAEGSDPGLCIAVPDRLSDPDLLIKFGFRAKEMVMEKKTPTCSPGSWAFTFRNMEAQVKV